MSPPSQFTPNTSCGPCLYCGASSEGRPQELVSCGLCRRPLHLTCLKNPPQTTLLGDNFFQVTCSACSQDGEETVERADVGDLHMLLLTLYNLHKTQEHTSKAGFFHWKIHVAHTLLNKYWSEVEVPSRHQKGRKKKILLATSTRLSHHSRFFQNGSEILGEAGWYRLVEVAPPALLLLNAMGRSHGERGALKEQSTDEDALSAALAAVKRELQEGGEERVFTEAGLLQPSHLHALTEEEERSKEVGGRHSKDVLDVKEEVDVKEESLEDEMFESVDSEENVVVDEVKEEDDEDFDSAECDEEDVEMSGREMRPSLFPPPTSAYPLMLHSSAKDRNRSTKGMGDDTDQEVVFNLRDNEVEVLEEEELAEVEEEEQDSQPSKKRKRKATQVILAEETEHLLGEWLEFDVPYFYNRGLPDYKNKAKQQAVLEEKGKSLDPPLTAVQLEQWLTTIRTRFGRLSKEKSGQGAVRLTDREKWILRTFHFLKPHITRQRKPRALGLSQSAASAAAPPDGNPRGPPEPSSGNESGTQEDPEVEEVTPAINLPRRKKLKTGSGIEKLIQDAAACRDTLREAVDVIHSNPEVEHWKALFDSHAQDAALIQGDLGLLLKMEIASLIRRFSAVQRSGRDVNEAELLLHTRENINRLVAPPSLPHSLPQSLPRRL